LFTWVAPDGLDGARDAAVDVGTEVAVAGGVEMGLAVLGVCVTAWLVVELAPLTGEPVVLAVQPDTAAARPIERSTVMVRVRASASIVISQMKDRRWAAMATHGWYPVVSQMFPAVLNSSDRFLGEQEADLAAPTPSQDLATTQAKDVVTRSQMPTYRTWAFNGAIVVTQPASSVATKHGTRMAT
jgi:hypothetical protein